MFEPVFSLHENRSIHFCRDLSGNRLTHIEFGAFSPLLASVLHLYVDEKLTPEFLMCLYFSKLSNNSITYIEDGALFLPLLNNLLKINQIFIPCDLYPFQRT